MTEKSSESTITILQAMKTNALFSKSQRRLAVSYDKFKWCSDFRYFYLSCCWFWCVSTDMFICSDVNLTGGSGLEVRGGLMVSANL